VNFNRKKEAVTAEYICDSIVTGTVHKKDIKPLIAQIRKCEVETKKSSLKKNLPAFTTSGTFNNERNEKCLLSYNSVVQIDLDYLIGSKIEVLKKNLSNIPGVVLGFVSPSGNGFKIIVLTDCEKQNHTKAFNEVKGYIVNRFNVKVDPSTKDIARLCFYSYDPDCYFNPEVEPFKTSKANNVKLEDYGSIPEPFGQPAALHFRHAVKKVAVPVEGKRVEANSVSLHKSSETTSLHNPGVPEVIFDLFKSQVEFTNRKQTFENGARNNYVHYLASNCSRIGIPKGHIVSLVGANYSLDKREIDDSISSAYKRGEGFGSKSDIAERLISLKHQGSPKTTFADTLFYPQSIYKSMPSFLTELCNLVSEKREKDVFLTSLLGGLSYCFPDIYYDYGDERIYSNLYVMIVAPAGSGKGKITLAKLIFEYIDKKSYATFKKEYISYKKSLNDCKKSSDCDHEDLVAPVRKEILLSGNTTGAATYKFLNNQDKRGLMMETEANAFTNAKEDQHGKQLSVIARQAYHHEAISTERAGDGLSATIYDPQLSIVLGGTPNQLKPLIKEVAGGLMSRFLFYPFDTEFVYKSRHNKNAFSMKEELEMFSGLLENIIKYTAANPYLFKLTKNQIVKNDKAFEAWFCEIDKSGIDEAKACIKRLPLATTKLAMIFTALRRYDEHKAEDMGICADVDFDNALELTKVYKDNILVVLKFLMRRGNVSKIDKEGVLEILPSQFETREAEAVASWYDIPEDSMRKYLKKVESDRLIRSMKMGTYRKV